MSRFFCPRCDNLMIQSYDGEKYGLIRTCIVCEYNSDPLVDTKDLFLKTNYLGVSSQTQDVNPNRCYDRTQQHTSQVKCPNKECPSQRPEVSRDVITYNYNQDFLQGFFCCLCKYQWSN